MISLLYATPAGIHSLPPDAKASILNKVRDFKTFNEDNGEHDFGAFKHAGERICWKIDYYAPDMQHGSEAPADLSKIVRMLTILLASEW